jgi:predicted acylesterase/phospholipase RssA
LLTHTEEMSPYAIVFSGGGALGAWEVGCCRAILAKHQNRLPTIVTGASAGAINAAGICAGLNVINLHNLWCGMTKQNIFARNFGAGTALALVGKAAIKRSIMEASEAILATKSSLFLTAPLEATLRKIFVPHMHLFDQSNILCVITLTDLGQHKKVCFYKTPKGISIPNESQKSDWRYIPNIETLILALMGSTALPILFPPYNNLFDGGVLNNQPILPAIQLGARLIYVLIPHPETPSLTTHLGSISEALLTTWLSQSLEIEIERTKLRNDITRAIDDPEDPLTALCIIRPSADLTATFGVGLLSFGEKVKELETNGFEAATIRLQSFKIADETTWY